ncbi:MAG: MBL fold metallo-hydrolase [Chloroflexota bacterium]
MEITVLGAHNTESKETRQVTLLVDGVLALDAGGLTGALSLEEQRRLKAILLTHGHYDHIRDVPALGMNLFLQESSIPVYGTEAVREALEKYLLNSELYPPFLKRPEGKPAVSFHALAPLTEVTVAGYKVTAVPVSHSVTATGFQVADADGKVIFYTGDTGAGLEECWRRVDPQLLIVELTMPKRWEEVARRVGHMTPGLLEQELTLFRKLKGYLPRVVTVHMAPTEEEEIAAEVAVVKASLGADIVLAREGMRLRV